MTKVDLKDAYFMVPIAICFPPQTATPFHLARADIPVQLPAIRSVISQCPLGLYQDHATCYCDPQSILGLRAIIYIDNIQIMAV